MPGCLSDPAPTCSDLLSDMDRDGPWHERYHRVAFRSANIRHPEEPEEPEEVAVHGAEHDIEDHGGAGSEDADVSISRRIEKGKYIRPQSNAAFHGIGSKGLGTSENSQRATTVPQGRGSMKKGQAAGDQKDVVGRHACQDAAAATKPCLARGIDAAEARHVGAALVDAGVSLPSDSFTGTKFKRGAVGGTALVSDRDAPEFESCPRAGKAGGGADVASGRNNDPCSWVKDAEGHHRQGQEREEKSMGPVTLEEALSWLGEINLNQQRITYKWDASVR